MWTFVFLLCAAAADVGMDGDVMVLDDSTLDAAVKEHTYLLVEFYAPWCGHCQKLAPEYSKAATALKSHSPPLPIAKVDATVNPVLTERFQITSFPTLKFFYHGKVREFDGGRVAEEIEYWVKEQVKPATKTLDTVDKVKAFVEKHGIAAVLFAAEASPEDVQFEIAAKMSGRKYYGVTRSEEIAKEFGVSQPALVVFNSKEETRAVYAGEWDDEKVLTFVREARLPLVMDFSPMAVEYSVQNHHPIIFVFRPAADAENLFPVLVSVAKAENQEIRFCHGDVTHEDYSRLSDFLGVSAQPTAILFDTRGEWPVKYQYTEGFLSAQGLRQFIAKWKSSELTPFVKSEADSSDPLSPVLRLTSNSYQKVTQDPALGVLVLLTADWCARCQALNLDELASAFNAYPYVQVARLDLMKNEVQGYKFADLPVVLWYPPVSDKSGLRYYGEMTTVKVEEWVKGQLKPREKTEL